MKLNRELTEKLFNCTTVEDLINVVNEAETLGIDLNTASRISIDEVLNKFYHKRCTGTKEHAVKMLIGAVHGEDIPDISTTPSLAPTPAMPLDQYVKEMSAEGEERMALIKESSEEAVSAMKKYYEYTDKIMAKSARLRALRATDDELAEIGKSSLVFVAGRDKSGKIYLMKREPKRMEDAIKWKWDLIV